MDCPRPTNFAAHTAAILSCLLVLFVGGCGDDATQNPSGPPMRPANLVVAALSPTSVLLQWDDLSDDEDLFAIYRAEKGPFARVDSTARDENNFVDSLLTDTTEYRYYVVAENGIGSSAPSETVAVYTPAAGFPPNPPSNPIPADNSVGLPLSVDLAWHCDDPDGDAVTFDLYFGSGSYLNLIDSNLVAPQHHLDSLEFDVTYNWKVIAADDDGHTVSGPVWHFTTGDSIFDIEITIAGGGHVTVDPDKPHFAPGDSVTLTAVPSSGWLFTGWSGDTSGTENPLLVIVTRDMSITANFAEIFDSTVAIISGTVTWPGHQLTAHTYAFADSFVYPNMYLVRQVSVDHLDGSFVMQFDALLDTIWLEFQAQDDVNDSGAWNPIDFGDGWGRYDANGDGDRNDYLPVYPGARIDSVYIVLHEFP